MEADIDGTLREILANCWGPRVRVTGMELLSKRISVVHRLHLEGGVNAPASVILKAVTPKHAARKSLYDDNPFFIEESVVHRFLAEIGAEQGLKPRLYATDHNTAMLIEDLGPVGYPVPRRIGELLLPLATAFARLHERSRPHLDRFHALRQAAGLGDGEKDRRGTASYRLAREAEVGRHYLLEQAALLGADADGIGEELTRAITEVTTPGPFTTLLHDDVAHGRQTFERGDEILLFDFEHARIGHALVDLSRLILGKFEIEHESKRRIWVNSEFPLDLIAGYRMRVSEEFGRTFPEAVWREATAAALIFATLHMIGYVRARAGRVTILGSERQNINGLLYRLGGRLRRLGGLYPRVQAFLPAMLRLPDLRVVEELTAAARLHRKAAAPAD